MDGSGYNWHALGSLLNYRLSKIAASRDGIASRLGKPNRDKPLPNPCGRTSNDTCGIGLQPSTG